MEYIVITGKSLVELEEKMNGAMVEGWTPIGGVSFNIIPEIKNGAYMQAIVRTNGLWVEEFGTSGRIEIGTGLELEGAENGV